MRRLIVHIGNPKTGSTSIQDFLFHNRTALADQGILFPIADGETSQAHAALPKSLTGGQLGPGQGQLTFPELKRRIAASSAPDILLSSEFFILAHEHPAISAAVGQLAAELDLALTIVLCVRPQPGWINSAYTQAVKQLRMALPFREFLDRSLEFKIYDLMRSSNPWINLKPDHFVALPFTRSHLSPSLEAAFLSAAGLGHVAMEHLVSTRSANQSPGPFTVEASRRVAVQMKRHKIADDTARAGARHIIARWAKTHDWDATPFNGIRKPLRDRVWAHFANINADFALRAWGKPWDDVFEGERNAAVPPNLANRETCSPADLRAINLCVREACAAVGLDMADLGD